MKVYAISARGSIVAITEKRKIAEKFVEERSNINPLIHKIEEKKVVNRILLELSDYHLEEDALLGILITQRESATFMKDIHNEFSRIKSNLRDMEFMVSKYNTPSEITKNLNKGIKALKDLSEPGTFGTVFGLEILTKGFNTSYMPLNRYIGGTNND